MRVKSEWNTSYELRSSTEIQHASLFQLMRCRKKGPALVSMCSYGSPSAVADANGEPWWKMCAASSMSRSSMSISH
eukprot:3724942-Prymnesium_polylepis.1